MNLLWQILQTNLIISLVVGFGWMFGRLLGKRAGYRWRKMLWGVLAVRLLFPFQLPVGEITIEIPIDEQLAESLFREEETLELVFPVEETPDPVLDGTNPAQGAINPVEAGIDVTIREEVLHGEDVISETDETWEADVISKTDAIQETDIVSKAHNTFAGKSFSIADYIVLIWGAGTVFLLMLRTWQYCNMRKTYFAETIPCNDSTVLECGNRLCKELKIRKAVPIRMLTQNAEQTSVFEHGPMLFGYFYTTLLLPKQNYHLPELESIMRHELTHYRTKDLWYKLLMVVVTDVYWFNPLCRLMKKMAFHDVELVCDEKVTGDMNTEAKKDYSTAILNVMSGNRGAALAFATRFAGTKKSAKERIENIFSVHNRKAGMVALCLLIPVLSVGTVSASVTLVPEEEEAPVAEMSEKEEASVAVMPEVEESFVTENNTQDILEQETEDFVLSEPYSYGNMQKNIPSGNYVKYGDKVLFTEFVAGGFHVNAYDMTTGEVDPFQVDYASVYNSGGGLRLGLEQYNGTIYGMNNNGRIVELKSDEAVQITEGEVGSFWHANNKIYAVNGEGALVVYENGSREPRILIEKYHCYWNVVFDGYLYGCNSKGITRVDLSAENLQVEMLVENANSMIDGEHIYYTDDDTCILYRCDMDGSNSVQLTEQGVLPASINFDEEYLYFRLYDGRLEGEGSHDLYRMKKEDGAVMEKIAELPHYAYQVYIVPGYDKIFIRAKEAFVQDTTATIYVVAKDGSSVEQLEFP